MFVLVGWDQKSAAAAAQTVMSMETKFADASLDNVALRNPSATGHNTTFVQLLNDGSSFDWADYFKAQPTPLKMLT